MDEVIIVERIDRVATVTLNRPDARNALNADLRTALARSMEDLDGDDSVDVMILTGTDPAFCAGVDLKEVGRGADDPTSQERNDRGRRVPFGPTSKPVIGAINGVAVTGGLEVALHCDFLIASERARFADTHARVGIQPGWGLTVLLPEAVGLRRARELSATGNYLDAQTALTWGLVNRVVPHEALLSTCREMAQDIVSNDQAGVRRILRTYEESSEAAHAPALEIEAHVLAEWMGSDGRRSREAGLRRQAVLERGRTQLS